MARVYYCWGCKADVLMLEAHEWKQINPVIERVVEDNFHTAFATPAERDAAFRREVEAQVFPLWELLTGYRPKDLHELVHVYDRFGPPCKTCGRPLRTRLASLCIECGTRREGW